MIIETREVRIARRKKEGYNNPKKDRWARRIRTIRPIKKPITEYLKDVVPTIKLKWYQKLYRYIINLFKKWLKK